METPIYLWCSVEVTWCLLRVIAFIDSAKTLRMDPCLIRLLSTPLDFSKEQASMDWWTLRLKKIYMNLKLFWAIVLMFLLNVKNNKHD